MRVKTAAAFMTAALLAIVLLFSLLWVASLWLANSSIVDMWWGPGFVLALGVYLEFQPPAHPRAWAVVLATTVWALRLAWHIGRRNIGHGEDPRYGAWREQHGRQWWWRSYFKVFLLQAAVLWVASWPLYFAVHEDARFPAPLDVLGLLLFVTGWLFETVGDAQLAAFKRAPANRGRVMDQGLWRYTRHPNYFGEALLWWGLGLVGMAAPSGWIGLIGPALMTFLLLRVSGVTMLERNLVNSKPGYADYIARTSSFVPWPPRRQLRQIT
jgi:steroid 5-alpha reductase family enzyme